MATDRSAGAGLVNGGTLEPGGDDSPRTDRIPHSSHRRSLNEISGRVLPPGALPERAVLILPAPTWDPCETDCSSPPQLVGRWCSEVCFDVNISIPVFCRLVVLAVPAFTLNLFSRP